MKKTFGEHLEATLTHTLKTLLFEQRESHIGWLSHDDEPLIGDVEDSHENLSGQAWAMSDNQALKSGKVRFYHHHMPNRVHHAGYEFVNKPHLRKLVDDHLARLGFTTLKSCSVPW